MIKIKKIFPIILFALVAVTMACNAAEASASTKTYSENAAAEDDASPAECASAPEQAPYTDVEKRDVDPRILEGVIDPRVY